MHTDRAVRRPSGEPVAMRLIVNRQTPVKTLPSLVVGNYIKWKEGTLLSSCKKSTILTRNFQNGGLVNYEAAVAPEMNPKFKSQVYHLDKSSGPIPVSHSKTVDFFKNRKESVVSNKFEECARFSYLYSLSQLIHLSGIFEVKLKKR